MSPRGASRVDSVDPGKCTVRLWVWVCFEVMSKFVQCLTGGCSFNQPVDSDPYKFIMICFPCLIGVGCSPVCPVLQVSSIISRLS